MRLANRLVTFCSVLLVTLFAQAGSFPKTLAGKVITSSRPIDIPTTNANFLKKLKKQDRAVFRKDDTGKWTIHFVAFFNRSLPGEKMGVVVLDGKKEPIALADVAGTRGQQTLASSIMVDTTEFPNKPHTIQIYYVKANKPVILAKKTITLK